jgi:phosphatidylglycerophosphate synthase
LRTRQRAWAHVVAAWLTRLRVPPNAISMTSILVAALAAAGYLALPGRSRGQQVLLLLAIGIFVQLRLLCNMLDGLVAIEGALHSPSGDLYNEIPDRIDDVLILAASGYAVPGIVWAPVAGWSAAALALFTAYVRLLGGTLGASQTFMGPMAKPHRMFVVTLASALSIIETLLIGFHGYALLGALCVVAVGSAVTAARRVAFIRANLPAP